MNDDRTRLPDPALPLFWVYVGLDSRRCGHQLVAVASCSLLLFSLVLVDVYLSQCFAGQFGSFSAYENRSTGI